MTTQELKLSITNLVNEANDNELLLSIYTILRKMLPEQEEPGIAGYEADGEPITEEALVKSILESQEEVKAGKKISFEELRAELGLK